MQHPRWREGRLSTGFIAEEFPDGFAAQPPTGETERVIAAIATHVDHVMNTRKREISGQLRAPSKLTFDLDRVVALGSNPDQADRRAEPRAASTSRSRTGGACASSRPGRRANRSGAATSTSGRLAAQVRPILNGFEIAHAGAQVAARVFTAARGRARRADARAQGRRQFRARCCARCQGW